jgi:hypothetical protein
MATNSKPDTDALTITPPDGYHYGDSHDWTKAEQKKLAEDLKAAWAKLRSAK